MTKLTKEMFDTGHGSERYIYFIPNGWTGSRDFIARFKHGSATACANDYVKHICKLVTKEELENILANAAPNGVTALSALLEARGWIHYNIRKAAKTLGVTPEYLKANPGYAYNSWKKVA